MRLARVKPLEGAKPSITVLAGIVLLGALLWVARDVLIPVALGVLLSFILTPAVLAMQRRGVSRTVAVTLVTILTMIVLGGAMLILTSQLHDLASDLPSHRENILQKIKDIKGGGPGLLDRWQDLLNDIIKILEQHPKPRTGFSIPVKEIEPNKTTMLETIWTVLYPVIKLLSMVSLVIALTVAMLFKREDLRNRLIRIAGQGQLTSTTRAIDEATRRISSYLVLQVTLNAGFGLVFAIGLFFIGVPYPLLWGVLAAAIRFVPYIGTWLAGFFPLIVSIAVSQGWAQPIAVIVFIVLLGLAVNNVLEPLLVSRSTGVSPIALIIAAAFWTWLWGPIGLILSTPMTVCLGVLGRYVPSLRFLDVMLGTDPALDPQYGYYQRLLARDELEATDLVVSYLQESSRTELCDRVILPTFVQAKELYSLGKVDREELQYIRSFTEELLDDELAVADPKEAESSAEVLVVGCPAKDAFDYLALQLFARLHGTSVRTELVSNETVFAELLERVRSTQPAGVLIAAVPPGGLGKIRYLCKRFRKEFPDLVILVGYWGLSVDESRLMTQLRSAGADHFSTTMSETLTQFVTHLGVTPEFPPNTLPEASPGTEKEVTVEIEASKVEVKAEGKSGEAAQVEVKDDTDDTGLPIVE